MPPWAITPLFRTAVGVSALLAILVTFGAPAWLMLAALLAGLTLLSILAVREHVREVTVRTELNQATERLAAAVEADPGTPVRTFADLPRRLETLADELAASLDAARLAHQSAAGWLAALPDPVLIIDAADVIQLCNAPACALLEVSCDRIIGRRTAEVFTQAELLRIVAQVRRSGTARLQVRISTPGGMRVWEVAAAPAPPATDVVLTLRDATDEAQSLQVKTDFVANASHELRTPIAALRTAVETLASLEVDDHAMRARLTGMIADNVARLEEMARDLLDLSRVESPEAPLRIRDVQASDLAAELTTMFDGVCRERGIALVFEIPPDLQTLRTDPDLLNLILRNLIDNATRFAFGGTAVRVVARPLPGAPGPRSGVRFEVIDRGQGIPLASQQRIFERYFQIDTARTTTAHRRGSGLGLAIVKHAVRRLGGTVRVQSVWQQGTTMTVDLPAAPAPESDSRPPQ